MRIYKYLMSSSSTVASLCCLLFVVGMTPTLAHASATNCDYRTWYGYSTGNAGDYAQCMYVGGRSEAVWEIKGSVYQWVQPGLGPGAPVPIPNTSNICTTIQFKYRKRGSSSYTYSSQSLPCHRPAFMNQQHRVYKPRHPFYLADRSNVCMRYKNSKTNNSYTGWTCIQIRK